MDSLNSCHIQVGLKPHLRLPRVIDSKPFGDRLKLTYRN